MLRYIGRRLLTLLATMLVVSVIVFGVVEVAPGNIARNILGHFATPEQERSIENQLGLDRPAWERYVSWLIGSDWQAERLLGMELVQIEVAGDLGIRSEWWAVDDQGRFVRWDVVDGSVIRLLRANDGSVTVEPDDGVWEDGEFWGVDSLNRAVLWRKGADEREYQLSYAGWIVSGDAPVDYLPLGRGVLRGDLGNSIIYRRPVAEVISTRLRNSAILAAISFAFSVPLAIGLGSIAGMNEGKWIDRILSLAGLVTTASPEFATGVLLTMIFGLWLGLLPGATVFVSDRAILSNPKMLVLPVLTVSLMEIGYVLRITRVSVANVARAAYVRTAILKGLPANRVMVHHILRNALLAPVTVVMLHVNWMIGGLVVVEAVFGFPGMGNLLLSAATYKDVQLLESGTLVMIVLAVVSQLVADVLYAYLNPKIRYQ